MSTAGNQKYTLELANNSALTDILANRKRRRRLAAAIMAHKPPRDDVQ